MFEKATEFLRTGIRLAPHDESAHFLAGILAMRGERFAEALSFFSRVVQSDPNRADAWSNIAAIHCHTQMWDLAYAAVGEAMKQDRRDWRLLNNAVLAAVRSRHYSRSLSLQLQLVNFRRERPPGVEGDEGGQGLDLALLAETVDAVLASGEEERVLAALPPLTEVAPVDDSPSQPSSDDVMPSQPLSLDFADDDELNGNAEVSAALPTRKHIDAAGNPAIIYLPSVISTLQKVVSLITPPPAVWLLLANALFESGDEDAALGALLRHTRALMMKDGWERGEPSRGRVIAATARYASLAKREDAQALAEVVCARLDAAATAAQVSSVGAAAEGVERLRVIAKNVV
jgi:tetratricopeptide (TPR) repeat protein